MPKKKRDVASRQAAVGKERKHRKLSRAHTPRGRVVPADPADVTVADTELAIPPTTPTGAPITPSLDGAREPVTRARVQPFPTNPVAASYQYVIAEIKRIGILAGAMVIILIILTFILG